MAKHKILMSRVVHTPQGFLVFNEGASEEVPDEFVDTFKREGVIAGSPSKASEPETAPKGGVASDASNTTATRKGVSGTASTGGTVGESTDAPAD